MIIYSSDKRGFCSDILTGDIENKIHFLMQQRGLRRVGQSELRSWENSLGFMHRVIEGSQLPDTAGVSIEYHIPNSSKRIDFIISGQDDGRNDNIVIVELKQWQTAQMTALPSIVTTRFAHGEKAVIHPSYQAWSYARLLEDFNQTIQDDGIGVKPCAFLHNYPDDGVINNKFYDEDIERAPLFLKQDILKLRSFVEKWVKYGDTENILYRIENGKIRPSKELASHLGSLLKGHREFTLIDDQKVVYESTLSIVSKNAPDSKTVVIIEGGPGTGKSVLAVNLLVELTNRGKLAQYVTKNAAPRAVYEAKLTGQMKKSQISNLFVGSGSFTESAENVFDVLLVDEAHRLNAKSGLFNNLGENQIKELINASKTSVFFLDEDQRVTLKDIGSKQEIIKWAEYHGARIVDFQLSAQFRCNGSDGYLAWLDHVLEIRETANTDLRSEEYDFQVFDSPATLYRTIVEKNGKKNKSRIVAGYCWEWNSKKDPNAYDIIIEEHDFKLRWNLTSYGSLWCIDPNSVTEAGCIHTCQGLELDYVGVIIGPDILYRNGKLVTAAEGRASSDQSIKGFKTFFKKDPVAAEQLVDPLIRNTYRTLMSRGVKGCYVYCVDAATNEYFKSLLNNGTQESVTYQKPSTFSKVASPKKKYSKKK